MPSALPQATLSRPRTQLVRGAQLLASVAVLWLLARDLDLDRMGAALQRPEAWRWLAAGLALKTLNLLSHELRLWLALPAPRPPFRQVLRIGFVAWLLNLVLPARMGDVAAMGMLTRLCGIPAATTAAAVGLVAWLEAVVFGLLGVVVLLAGADRWGELLGGVAQAQALHLATLGTLGGVAVLALVVLLARRLGPTEAVDSELLEGSTAPRRLLRDALSRAGSNLESRRWLAEQLSLALLGNLLTLGAFVTAFHTAGIEVSLPWLAASGVMVLSALAAAVLPPALGAGPAAASVAVLAVFGVDTTGALLYAATWWCIATLPTVMVGLPALWRLRGVGPTG